MQFDNNRFFKKPKKLPINSEKLINKKFTSKYKYLNFFSAFWFQFFSAIPQEPEKLITLENTCFAETPSFFIPACQEDE